MLQQVNRFNGLEELRAVTPHSIVREQLESPCVRLKKLRRLDHYANYKTQQQPHQQIRQQEPQSKR